MFSFSAIRKSSTASTDQTLGPINVSTLKTMSFGISGRLPSDLIKAVPFLPARGFRFRSSRGLVQIPPPLGVQDQCFNSSSGGNFRGLFFSGQALRYEVFVAAVDHYVEDWLLELFYREQVVLIV